MLPVIFYRESQTPEEEQIAIKKYFASTTTRTQLPKGTTHLVGRYSVLPYYQETYNDIRLAHHISLINTPEHHRFAADVGNWATTFEGFTPRTWDRLEDIPEQGPFVLKGETNSRKDHWRTHMFAKDKKEAIQVALRLGEDSLISSQKLYIREYVPLQSYGTSLGGAPIAHEFRLFFLYGIFVIGGFYWSNYTDQLTIPTPTINEVPSHIFLKISERLKDNINFCAVDVAKTQSGEWIVIEVNDGQMSGLSEINADEFYSELQVHLIAHITKTHSNG